MIVAKMGSIWPKLAMIMKITSWEGKSGGERRGWGSCDGPSGACHGGGGHG